MYSYALKGWTVGYLLTRRALRTITGIPGLVIDALSALFWIPNYQDYWKKIPISYGDGTQVSLFRGLFGWIGDIVGCAVGAPVGALLGLAVYTLDAVLWALRSTLNFIYDKLNKFASYIAETAAFSKNFITLSPINYFAKS